MSKGKSPYQLAMRKRKKELKKGKGQIMNGLMKQFKNASDEEAFEMASGIVDSIDKTEEVVDVEESMGEGLEPYVATTDEMRKVQM